MWLTGTFGKSACVNTKWTVQWPTTLLCTNFPEMFNWGPQRLFWIEMLLFFCPVVFEIALNFHVFQIKGTDILCVHPYKEIFYSWVHHNVCIFQVTFSPWAAEISSLGAEGWLCKALTLENVMFQKPRVRLILGITYNDLWQVLSPLFTYSEPTLSFTETNWHLVYI